GLLNSHRVEGVAPYRMDEFRRLIAESARRGFSFGQLVYLMSRSVAKAVSWGERRGLLSGSRVSSAAVTMLSRHLQQSDPELLPEYSPPDWLPIPAALHVAEDVLCCADLTQLAR